MATAPYDTFQTRDGRWIFVGVASDVSWHRLCTALNMTDFLDNPRLATVGGRGAAKHEVNNRVQECLASKDRTELLELFHRTGVPAAPVYTFDEVPQDPHVRAAGVLTDVIYEARTVPIPRFPVNAAPDELDSPPPSPPQLGQDNRDLLQELGYADVEALLTSGVLGGGHR